MTDAMMQKLEDASATKNSGPVVPLRIEDAQADLTQLDVIATKAGWYRAALVYAFTCDGRGVTGGSPGGKNGDFTVLDCTRFAALDIAGLKSDQTVRNYRKAWQQAVDAGYAEPTQPGAKFTIPNLAWEERGQLAPAPEPEPEPAPAPPPPEPAPEREHIDRDTGEVLDGPEPAPQTGPVIHEPEAPQGEPVYHEESGFLASKCYPGDTWRYNDFNDAKRQAEHWIKSICNEAQEYPLDSKADTLDWLAAKLTRQAEKTRKAAKQ